MIAGVGDNPISEISLDEHAKSFEKLKILTHKLFVAAYEKDCDQLSVNDQLVLKSLRVELDDEFATIKRCMKNSQGAPEIRNFVSQLPFAALVLNNQKQVMYGNELAERLFHVSRRKRLGIPNSGFHTLFHDNEAKKCLSALESIRFRQERSVTIRVLARRFDGVCFPANVTFSNLRVDASNSVYTLCSIQDASSERMSEFSMRLFGRHLMQLSPIQYYRSLLKSLGADNFIQASVLLLFSHQCSREAEVYYFNEDDVFQTKKISFYAFSEQLHSDDGFHLDVLSQIEGEFRCLHKQALKSLTARLEYFPILSHINNEILGFIVAEVDDDCFDRRQFDFFCGLLSRPLTDQTVESFVSNLQTIYDSRSLDSSVGVGETQWKELQKVYDEKTRLIREIDARKRAEISLVVEKRRAEKANRTKTQFLANMSHEIRTPLNGIMGLLSILSEMPASAKQKQYFDMMNQSSKVLLRLVNDILDLSRIEMGQMNLRHEAFDFRATIYELLNSHLISAEKKNIDLMVSYPHNQPNELMADEVRLRQIIDNLVSNAIKFTNRGGVYVKVRFKSLKDVNKYLLLLSVKDTGCGISAKDLKTIWRQFERIDNSTTRTSEGFGLGLSIAKKIVKDMKGRVGISSSLGEGSDFTLSIPVAISVKNKHSHPSPLAENPRVFLICKSEAAYSILHQMLSSMSYLVHRLDRLPSSKEWKVEDYVLMDYEALRVLKESNNFQKWNKSRLNGCGQVLVALSHASLVSDLPSGVRLLDSGLMIKKNQNIIFDLNRNKQKGLADKNLVPEFNGLRILLAEDNEISRSVGVDMLTHRGALVTSAKNGRQALSIAQKQVFDIILMDCFMPEMDGVAAMEAIRSSLNHPPPIVAVTANAVKGASRHYLSLGFDGYLSKPFVAKDLYRLVDDMIAQKDVPASVS